MRCYDTYSIIRYVSRYKSNLDRIDIGIREDWMNTNQRIYSNGKLLIDLPRRDKPLIIRGIRGSMWGTPVMRAVFKDGKVDVVSAFKTVGSNMSPVKMQDIITETKQFGKVLGWNGVLK